MKKCLLFLLLFCMNSHAKKLQLVTGDFLPFASSELENGGLASEIVTLTFAQMGNQVEINFRPWKRGYRDLKSRHKELILINRQTIDGVNIEIKATEIRAEVINSF